MGEVTAAIGISDLKYVIEDLLAGVIPPILA